MNFMGNPSVTSNVAFLGEAAPTAPTVAQVATSSGNCTAGTHVFAIAVITPNGETQLGAASSAVTCDGTYKQVTVSSIPVGSSWATGRDVCASLAGTTSPLYLVAASPVINNNTATTYTFNTADGSLTNLCPLINTTAGGIGIAGTQAIQVSPVTGTVDRINLSSPNTAGTAGIITVGGDSILNVTLLGVNESTFLGDQTGNFAGTGYSNTGVGSQVMPLVTTGGQYNVGVGTQALQSLLIGADNVAIGYKAGGRITSGAANVLIGESAGFNSTSSGSNDAVGYDALFYTTGSSNSALGHFAGYQTTGNYNSFLGYHAGYTLTSGSDDTFLGASADTSLNSVTNATALGYQAVVATSNMMVFGNTSVINNLFHGHITTSSTAPGVTGTGCSLTSGNDTNGTIAATGADACAVAFHTAYTAPVCVLTASATTTNPVVSALVITGFTVTTAATGTVYYHCEDVQ